MLASGKSPSTSQLPIITTFNGSSDFDDEMSTLPDPRSRAMSSADDSNAPTPSRHPDLNDEVATLSTKLINAINHQTHLDDTLSETRQELEAARERIRDLEIQNASQREMLAGDVWVRKHTVEAEKKVWQAKIAEEKHKRLDTEREKKKIEQELENLTAALFEEANRMVIGAKEEAAADHDVLQKKNDQLKTQLADCESLLKSQQEQLSELKHVMEHMVTERDDGTNVTAPSSPGFPKSDIRDYEPSTAEGPNPSLLVSTATPAHPTSFPHLVQPVLRTDLSSYDDFINLARLSRTRANSRVSSGSIGGLSALTLGLGGSTSSAHPSNASTTSLTTSAPTTTGSAPQSPNTPASAVSVNSTASSAPLPSLKDTKFFKRVQAEDVEPTLRLDIAPGLSWLARRSVISAMTEGTLVVEPVPTNTPYYAITKPQHYPCSLCGETRKTDAHLRTHRFRTSEADSAQRYPLCPYCLNRVRSTCDFLGFLRMVKDGHWRADDEDQEKAAWEESVRLRDQMFWARIGGGVVPAHPSHISDELEKSPRPSQDLSIYSKELVVEKNRTVTREGSPVDRSRGRSERAESATEELYTPPEQVESAEPVIEEPVIEEPAAEEPAAEELHTSPEQVEGAECAKSVRDSVQSLEVKSIAGSEDSKRLSITIPISG